MTTMDFLDNLRKIAPERWTLIQNTYNFNVSVLNKFSSTIINCISQELLNKIFKSDFYYDVESEASIIEVIMRTGIHQELVFRFFYSFLQAMNVRNCKMAFQEWYIPNPFDKEKISSHFSFPKIQMGFDKAEADERGIIIDMQNPPQLSLLPCWGVTQWSHGPSLITTYKRWRAHIDISVRIKMLKKTEKFKALCIGVYDENNRVVVAARIWQWYDNSSDFEIPVEFDCELETLRRNLHRVYFYWEGSPKNYSYLNRLAYRQNL